jgi:hypothetical protein
LIFLKKCIKIITIPNLRSNPQPVWSDVQHALTLFLSLALFKGLGLLADWRNKQKNHSATGKIKHSPRTIKRELNHQIKKAKKQNTGLTLTLTKTQRTLNLPKGFCPNHPDETRLVMGSRSNECYSCLLKVKATTRKGKP